MLFLWVLTCFLIITIFCIAVYYTKREIKQLESFSVSEESSTLGNSSAFIVLYDVSKNLGLNLERNRANAQGILAQGLVVRAAY